MISILTDYNSLNEADFTRQVDTIVTMMTGNTSFPDQQSKVRDVFNLLESFRRLVAESTTGTRQVIRQKNTTRINLTTLVIGVGQAVAGVCASNLDMLDSSGFPLSKQRTQSPSLMQPVIVSVKAGTQNGEILFQGKRQKGTVNFTYFITTDLASGKWDSFSTTKGKFLFTGLASNTRYYIRYAINGVRNQTMMSDTVAYTPPVTGA